MSSSISRLSIHSQMPCRTNSTQRMSSKKIIAALASLAIPMAVITAEAKDIYSSKTYRFSIERRCQEGWVSCNNVQLEIYNKKTGENLRILGSTHHSTCADGISPCRFIGYIFKKDDLKIVIDYQNIVLIRNGTQILREQLK